MRRARLWVQPKGGRKGTRERRRRRVRSYREGVEQGSVEGFPVNAVSHQHDIVWHSLVN